MSELRGEREAGGTSALTWRALAEALAVSAVVTGLVTAASMFVPEKYVALSVGGIFLGAAALLVWRRDDTAVMRAGLTLGGVVLQGPLDVPGDPETKGSFVDGRRQPREVPAHEHGLVRRQVVRQIPARHLEVRWPLGEHGQVGRLARPAHRAGGAPWVRRPA